MVQRSTTKKPNVVFIDFYPLYTKKILVGIIRNAKGRITYNTGLIYFESTELQQDFIKRASKKYPDLELIPVDSMGHNPPPEDGKHHKGYWCPYCQRWEYWRTSNGYKLCPICGMSDGDYYVRKYNHLWTKEMKNQKDKKHEESMKKKAIKRREKDK